MEKLQEIATYTQFPVQLNNINEYRGLQFSINQDSIDILEYTNANRDLPATLGGLRFNYSRPRNVEDRIVFSQDLGNLGAYKYNFSMPTITQGVVGVPTGAAGCGFSY